MNLVGNAIKFTQKGKVSLASKWLPDDSTVHESNLNKLPHIKYYNKRNSHLLSWSSKNMEYTEMLRPLDAWELK